METPSHVHGMVTQGLQVHLVPPTPTFKVDLWPFMAKGVGSLVAPTTFLLAQHFPHS